MKKFVICLMFLLPVVLCGCSAREYGSTAELTMYGWTAQLEGGGSARLCFDGENASLTLKSGDETAVIEGRVIADDSGFVIFDEALGQSYGFGYVPRGEKLELSYGGHTIEMKRE